MRPIYFLILKFTLFFFLAFNSDFVYAQDIICRSSANHTTSESDKFSLKDLITKHQEQGPQSWLSEDLLFVKNFEDQFNYMISSLDQSISSKKYASLLEKEFENFKALLSLKKDFPLRYEEMMNLSFHFVVLNDLKYLPEKTNDIKSIGDYIYATIAELKASYEEIVEVANEIGFDLKFLPYHKPVGYPSLSRSFVSGLGLLLLTDKWSKVDNVDMPPSLALRHDFDHFLSSVDFTMGAVLGLADVNLKTRYVGDRDSRKRIWDYMHTAFFRLFNKIDQVKDSLERERIEILFFYLTHEFDFYFPVEMQKFVLKKLLLNNRGDLSINLLNHDESDFDFAKIIRIIEKEIPDKNKSSLDEWLDALEFLYENFAPEIDDSFDLERNWKRNIPTN